MTAGEIERAVTAAGLGALLPGASDRFEKYLALLLKWNSKLNLTAIREPSEIVRRQFLESIQCARTLPDVSTLLDFGSGGGFPGIPIAILRPEIQVTLGESQAKKAAFLREAVRSLGLNASVYDGRIERMDLRCQFDIVTLRAVDKMVEACSLALARVTPGGWLVAFATASTEDRVRSAVNLVTWEESIPLTDLKDGFLVMGRKTA